MVRFSPSTLGWFPTFVQYSSMPNDVIEVSDETWRALMGKVIEAGPDGMPREVQPSPPNPVDMLTQALQAEMDAKARTLGYDDIKAAISYRGDPNTKFATEAEALFLWRSAVWTQAYALLEQVQQGEAQFPTVQDAIDMMPALVI